MSDDIKAALRQKAIDHAALQARAKELDAYAIPAMQGLLANSIPGSHHRPDRVARDAYDMAEVMIAERASRLKDYPK